MRIILSDFAFKQLNKLYGDRRVFLTDETFTDSFKFYNKQLHIALYTLSNRTVPFVMNKGYRVSNLGNIIVTYRLMASLNVIAIYSFGFIGLPHLYRLCTYERKQKNASLGKRPTNIKASINPNDYKSIPNGDGGRINNVPVYIVQRKGVTSPSGKELFNYFCNGRILSNIDFLSATPFCFYPDENAYKAYADSANGKRYWVLSSGRRLLYCSIEKLDNIITETINRYLKNNLLIA